MSSRTTSRVPRRSAARPRSTWDAAPSDGRRDRLSRDRIVAAAMAIADTEGLTALSIRHVADTLGASPMALYTYVPNKQDLLNLMLDAAHAELSLRPETLSNWRELLTEIAWELRRLLTRHPWLLAVRSSDPEHGPAYIRGLEFTLALGQQFGIRPETTARILNALDALACGSMPSTSGRHLPVVSPALLESGVFPIVAALAASEPETDGDTRFASAVRWLLDGVAADIGLSGPPTPKPPRRRSRPRR